MDVLNLLSSRANMMIGRLGTNAFLLLAVGLVLLGLYAKLVCGSRSVGPFVMWSGIGLLFWRAVL